MKSRRNKVVTLTFNIAFLFRSDEAQFCEVFQDLKNEKGHVSHMKDVRNAYKFV
jgi:hypothetical protein